MDGQNAQREVVSPIMVRAEISADEWRAVRMAAIEGKVTTQRLIGDILRAYLRKNEVPV